MVHNGCTFIYADEYNWRLHVEKVKFYNWSDQIFQKIWFQMVRQLLEVHKFRVEFFSRPVFEESHDLIGKIVVKHLEVRSVYLY